MKLPSLQFYPGDWRKDPGVQALSYHDRGVWFEILCLMHESPQRGKLLLAGKAMPDTALARLLGLDKQNLSATLSNLLDYGVASRDESSGALVSRRMVRDEELRAERAAGGELGREFGHLGAEHGKKGGRPRKNGGIKAPSERPSKPPFDTPLKPAPSSSSSFSSSEDTPFPPGEENEGVKDLCTIEQARAYARSGQVRMSQAAVDYWFLSRKAVGWRRGGVGNPRIVSWQSDMAGCIVWAEKGAAEGPAAAGEWKPRFPGEKPPKSR